jgi:hypothetical protein
MAGGAMKYSYDRRASRVVVKQHGRQEWDIGFLKTLVRRIVDAIPGASKLPLVQVEFRERGDINRPAHGSKPDGLTYGGAVVQIRKPRSQGPLGFRNVCETIAHEIVHLVQHYQGLNDSGPKGGIGAMRREVRNNELGTSWNGEYWPKDTAYLKQPWEIEAAKLGDRYGQLVFNQLEQDGLLPTSHTDKFEQELEKHRERVNDSPTFGDLAVLPDDVQFDIILRLRKNQMTNQEAWDLIRAAR